MPNFLALFMGSDEATRRGEANPPNPEVIAKGMAAWGQWMADHGGAIVDTGGPVGKTKQASPDGLSDTRNHVAGYVIVSARDHDTAVKLFEGHPHFTIFPGDRVEVMPILPIPTAP